MVDTLTVQNGNTETVSANQTDEYLNADIDGTLDIDGSLVLKTNYDGTTQPGGGSTPTPTPTTEPASSSGGGGINLPTGSIDFEEMETSTAILFVGLIGALGGAAAILRNYAAGVLIAMGVVALILAGMFNLGVEIFYAFIIGASLMIAAGVAVNWSGVG